METSILDVRGVLSFDCLGNKISRLASPYELCPFLKIFGNLNSIEFTFTYMNSFIIGLICPPRTAFLSGLGCSLAKIGLMINTGFAIFIAVVAGFCWFLIVWLLVFALCLGAYYLYGEDR